MAREDAEHDAAQYECETCAVAAAYTAMAADPRNVRAWTLYGQIANRFTSETQSVGLAFDRLTRHASDADYCDLLHRMGILVETFHPQETTADGA